MIRFHMKWITSKRWFSDWDILIDHFKIYLSLQWRCEQLHKVVSHLATKLDQKVIMEQVFITGHNPARALTIDWNEIDHYNKIYEWPITPEYFDLSEQEVLDILNLK